MSTIQYQKIGLQLAGTKSRQGGFSPRIAIGMLAGGEKADNMYRATLVSENPMCVVRHAKDYIVYELIDRKVRPCDIDTLGALGIIMTVARDMQFTDSKSPYEVLHEVYEKYKTTYMKCDSDGVYRFLDIEVNQDEFTEIVARYPLEPRRGTYVEMNPSGMTATLCVRPDKLSAFFRDTQYPEFRQFKEVEVGVSCATIAGLEQLEIPRRKKYSIIVNDLLTGDIKNAEGILLSLPTDLFDTSRLLHNTADVLYDNVFFTLSQLQENGGRLEIAKSTVVLNEDKDRIECSVYGERRYYDMEYTITGLNREGQNAVAELIRRGIVNIQLGGQTVPFTSQKTRIPVSQAYKPVTINNQTTDYLLTCQYEHDNETRCLKVTIQGKKKEVVISNHPKDIYGDNDDSHQSRNPHSSQSNRQKFHKQNNPNDSFDEEKQSDKNVHHSYDKKGLIPFIIGLFLGLLVGGIISWVVCSSINKKQGDGISEEQNPTPVLTEGNAISAANIDSPVDEVNPSVTSVDSPIQAEVHEEETGTDTASDDEAIEKERKRKEKEEKCKELLDKINAKTFTTFSLNGGDYKPYFTSQQRTRIEAVTNPILYDSYKNIQKNKLKPQIARKIKEEIEKQWPKNGFKTFDEIYKFREDVIMPYINNEDNFKNN